MNSSPMQPLQQAGRTERVLTIEDLAQTYDAARFAPRNKEDLKEIADDYYVSGTLPDVYYAPQYRTDGNGKVIRDDRGVPSRIQYTEDERKWHRRRGVAMAIVVMRYGAMLRVLPEAAINSIYLIDNKPSPSAALMVACALARPDICAFIQTITSTPDKCIIRVQRRGQEPEEIEATAEEYKHLHIRKTWTQYRTDMVYARCVARAMRRKFPDLFHGVYCVEERTDMQFERAQGVAAPEPTEALEAVLGLVASSDQRETADAETPPPQPVVPPAEIEAKQAPATLTDAEIEFVRGAMNRTVGIPVRSPMQRTVLMGLLRDHRAPQQTIELMMAYAQAEIDAAQAAQKGSSR